MLIVGFGCVRLLDGVDFYHQLFEFRWNVVADCYASLDY
jgi:hypothetical protein